MMKFSLYIPTRLEFGCGKIRSLSQLPMPGKRALVVVSGGASMTKFGYLDFVVKQMQMAGVSSLVLAKVKPNPVKETVQEGAELCRKEHCDFVVGLGGGSSIDTAKAIAVLAAMGGDLWDYATGGSGKKKPVTKSLPVVAIPTTAGTGTEIDPWCVITDETINEKLGFGGTEPWFPVLAVVDPELMVSVPPRLTAYQGFDALFHAVEGYLNSKLASPVSDLYALEAIRLVSKYLPSAVHDGRDLHARTKLTWASTLAGMVESTSGCISQHAMEQTMSAFYPKLPHGAGLIALSGAYFKTFKNDAMKRYMKMSEKMRLQKSARPSDFLDALELLKRQCGVDKIKLSEWGITPADFDRFADNALATAPGAFDMDPRFLTREDIIDIYLKSYK